MWGNQSFISNKSSSVLISLFSFEIWHVLSKVYDKGGLKISKQGEGESLV